MPTHDRPKSPGTPDSPSSSSSLEDDVAKAAKNSAKFSSASSAATFRTLYSQATVDEAAKEREKRERDAPAQQEVQEKQQRLAFKEELKKDGEWNAENQHLKQNISALEKTLELMKVAYHAEHSGAFSRKKYAEPINKLISAVENVKKSGMDAFEKERAPSVAALTQFVKGAESRTDTKMSDSSKTQFNEQQKKLQSQVAVVSRKENVVLNNIYSQQVQRVADEFLRLSSENKSRLISIMFKEEKKHFYSKALADVLVNIYRNEPLRAVLGKEVQEKLQACINRIVMASDVADRPRPVQLRRPS